MSSLAIGSGGEPSGYRVIIDRWERVYSENVYRQSSSTIQLNRVQLKEKSVLIIPTFRDYINGSYWETIFTSKSLTWESDSYTNLYCDGFSVDGQDMKLYTQYGGSTSVHTELGYGTNSPSTSDDVGPSWMNAVYTTGGWVDYIPIDNILNVWGDSPTKPLCRQRGSIFIPMKESASLIIRNKDTNTHQTALIVWGIGHLEQLDNLWERS